MLVKRPAEARGKAQFGWLDSRHSFSFGQYYDPAHMGFGPLRVINEDKVVPGAGFGEHGHRDMEIISYVLEGGLEHRDSMGNGSVIRPGQVQKMSAGTGVRHSEFNASRDAPVHFLQIWIEPSRLGLPPSYEEARISLNDGVLTLIASEDGRDGAVGINRDVDLYAARLDQGAEIAHALAADRLAWVQVVRGELSVNGTALRAGDGAALRAEAAVRLRDARAAEVLLFDMAA
ncbi:MAG: pirin family protein [Geminicoccaceae bacterium]